MEVTKQMYFDRIGDFIIECNNTAYKRLWAGYEKMSCWLRNNNLETPFLKLRTAFVELRDEWEIHGVTSDLNGKAYDVAAKAKMFADECYKHEDGWNPTLDQEITKVLGHTYTITEWMRVQSEHVTSYMDGILRYYQEGCNVETSNK